MGDERMMEKIRGLLTLATREEGTPEGDSARERAEMLMMKWSIDEAILGDVHGATAEQVERRTIPLETPYAKAKSVLLCTIGHYNQVRTVVHHNKRGYGYGASATILGFPSDLARVEVLYTSLLVQACRGVMQQRPPVRYNSDGTPRRRESARAYRVSWMLGFTKAVAVRLNKMHRRSQQQADAENISGRGTELVLRDRNAVVDDAFREQFPQARKTTISSSGSGSRQGYAAGEQADLEQTRFGGARRAALT